MSGFGNESIVVPDVVEPIRAYRAWSCSDDGVLRGYGGTEWPTDEPLTAGCSGTSDWPGGLRFVMNDYVDPTPCVECPSPTRGSHAGYGCGIYGYRTPLDLAANGGAKVVWGEVLLWGTVYEHAKGWRAEIAQVAALYRLPCSHWSGKAAKRYGVDLLPSPFTQADIDRARAPKVDLTKHQRTFWSTSDWNTGGALWVSSVPTAEKKKKKKGRRRG